MQGFLVSIFFIALFIVHFRPNTAVAQLEVMALFVCAYPDRARPPVAVMQKTFFIVPTNNFHYIQMSILLSRNLIFCEAKATPRCTAHCRADHVLSCDA